MISVNPFPQKAISIGIKKSGIAKSASIKSATPTFKGADDTPPKMPEFLKPYYDEPQPKAPGKLKSALIIGGAGAAIVGFTALCATFLPAAIAGAPIFIGVLALTMGALNWTVPAYKPPKGHRMTMEQQMEASKYDRAVRRYERQQKWKKFKNSISGLFK
ncbi:MAG TPA: hypothetical protein VN132_08995 [Bdellovibrio sp.]|nr:hypothetical protein [Bdellovibrio sp.]